MQHIGRLPASVCSHFSLYKNQLDIVLSLPLGACKLSFLVYAYFKSCDYAASSRMMDLIRLVMHEQVTSALKSPMPPATARTAMRTFEMAKAQVI